MGFLSGLKHHVHRLFEFWNWERAGHDSPVRSLNPKMLAMGFFSGKASRYPFSRFEARWYVTDWELLFRLSRVNGHVVKSIFNNKLFCHLALRERGFADKIPKLIGLFSQLGFTSYSKFSTVDEVLEFHPTLFMKPMEGSGGNGVFCTNDPQSVHFPQPYIAEVPIQPHAYGFVIFPRCLNTIRILAMRDVYTNEFFISHAIHRFGTRKTIPVDNFSKGGLCARIDLESGVLSEAKWYAGKSENDWISIHPDTKAAIKGVVIPHWDEAKQLALTASEAFPDLQIAGWDLAITPRGPILIEGNVGAPGLDLIQSHSPVLLDRRVCMFMKQHGVISARKAKYLDRRAAKMPPGDHKA
jgi:hypothetical protein